MILKRKTKGGSNQESQMNNADWDYGYIGSDYRWLGFRLIIKFK